VPSKNWVAELEGWDREHGLDIPTLFDAHPDLFRALSEERSALKNTALGQKYIQAIHAIVDRARASDLYTLGFESLPDAATDKEQVSFGTREKK
jgi:hypothetical protein